jgi:hypothetical protein
MAAACTSACGYCGGCTAPWEREQEPAAAECEACGDTLPAHPVTLTHGVYCSARCADVGTALDTQLI